MKLLELVMALTLMLASVDAATTPAPESSSPPVFAGSNSNSTLTTATIESTWVLYTGSALKGFQSVVFTKQDGDPSDKCYLTGYYDPTARNATSAVNCFLDLQALVVYSYQQGTRIYYTGVMYIAGPDGPENDCAVFCKSYNTTSAATPLHGSLLSGYGSWSWTMIVSTALVVMTELIYESWT
ncbi:hypothetical protein R1flu_015875 [Riccia fluitans]|uniref:Uncharacterized protein n=1 Tax=Riccia fluitans TaxID=41844 RepID=A0ABD1YK80_9MARC